MMNILSVLPPSFCVFFLFFNLSRISIASTPTPPYIADEKITISCGASADLNDMDGRRWTGDMGSNFGSIGGRDINSFNATRPISKDDAVHGVPYMTARQSFFNITYQFPVTNGPKFIRLYFYPGDYLSKGGVKDLFTVKAGSFTLLANFSASDTVNASRTLPLRKEFCVNLEQPVLILTFISFPSTNNDKFYAFINGIEIVSMPNYLYNSGSLGYAIPYIGQTERRYNISSDIALETVHRLNVGGAFIPPMSDTGMFREWSDDSPYRLSDEFVNLSDPSLTLRYTIIKNYTAPDDVYRTALSMGPNRTRNLLSNLTWGLPVALGFNYLVRLHFCEIQPEITKVGERPFTIYIDNQTAETTVDVIMWSEGRADTPVFRDYVLLMEKRGIKDNSTLFITLHPRKDTHAINNAILNGVEVLKLIPLLPGSRHESKLKNTIIIVTGSGVGLLILLILMWFMVLSKMRKTNSYASYGSPLSKYCWCWGWPDPSKNKSTGTKASSTPDGFCRHFSLSELKTATRNFHEELIVGVGGFGNVYKGLIDRGTVTVAIKRLNQESRQGVYEFRTEIEMLSRLRHVHLVSLIGYCEEKGEMILVYDYMANGTLRHHLYDIESNHFSWKQRLKICIGAARGLHYLHTGAKNPIIHRDVKTTNILLDQDWVAKVSDFGLSKMSVDNNEVTTMVKGTWGYLDPEYARRQKLSEKSDVYSFGVVLWEVLCARKALDQKLEEEQWNLANWVTKCIERGSIGQIIDPYLKGKIAPKSFKVYVEVAEGCVREQGIQRPTMDDVMEKLRFALELQENEDAAIDKLNLASDLTYPDLLSSHYVVYSEHTSEMGSGSGLTMTTTSDSTYQTRDSGTIRSSKEDTRDGPKEIEDSTTH